MSTPLRVLVVGCGHMGSSHARAYQRMPDFKIVGLVSRGVASRDQLATALGGGCPTFASYDEALAQTKPDAVCISTYPDTHATFARRALEHGCHVFLEKPIATALQDARELIALSQRLGRKLVLGYILQHHPSWDLFVREARKLGKPLVMRMNLNQQSSGAEWQTHKNIMQSMAPMVDCGVHYVDVMCRMTQARPVRVHAIQARLSSELVPGMANYGQLQVTFDDGSVGWYEAGWGPMMSTTAGFVKDVIGPLGSVSIADAIAENAASDDVNAHTKTAALRVHRAALDADNRFAHRDELLITSGEPDHDSLCATEQAFFARTIREDLDLGEHLSAVLHSLQIVLAAAESARTGESIRLESLS